MRAKRFAMPDLPPDARFKIFQIRRGGSITREFGKSIIQRIVRFHNNFNEYIVAKPSIYFNRAQDQLQQLMKRVLIFLCGLFLTQAQPAVSGEDAAPGFPEVATSETDAELLARIKAIRDRMDEVLIERLDIHDQDLRGAIGALQKAASNGKHGFSFILKTSDSESIRAETGEPSRLKLDNVSLPEALNYICLRYGMVWSCEGKILIQPQAITR